MPPKKKDTGSKGGRPTGAKTTKFGGQVSAEADLHPELHSNWMEFKPMVYDEEKIPDVNEIHKIMKECIQLFSTASNSSPSGTYT